MHIPDSVLSDMIFNGIHRVPGVEMVEDKRGIEFGHSYRAVVVMDMHPKYDFGPWHVVYHADSRRRAITVIFDDCDEAAVEAKFVQEQEGKRRGVWQSNEQWTEAQGQFRDDERDIVIALLTHGTWYDEVPDHVRKYLEFCRETEERRAAREAAEAGENA